MNRRHVMVTGATGFVGQALCAEASARGLTVRGITRKLRASPLEPHHFQVGDIDGATDWSHALRNCDCIVHLASRVHVMQETIADPLPEFRRVNVEGTLNLARQAAAAGVRRFVFVSSIKVNGERTLPGHPFKPDDVPAPGDAYGISKLEAEKGLRVIASNAAMELVILRPPLVYGPGVKANFAAMIRWLQRGIPLPLGGIDNLRSLVALGNLNDLLLLCLSHPAAAGQIFLVSDDEDVSTSVLLRRVAAGIGRPARLFRIPPVCLNIFAALLGKRSTVDRLCDSLQLDIGKTRRLLDWRPPLTLDQGLRLLRMKD